MSTIQVSIVKKVGSTSTYQTVKKFYRDVSYGGEIPPEDTVVMVYADNELVGCCRLSNEFGITVLRGVQIKKTWQGKGIGRKLLTEAMKEVGKKECYCIPYVTLEKFYASVGFMQVGETSTPVLLQRRLNKYRDVGMNVIVMKKQGAGFF